MLKNYFHTATQNLAKHKLVSLINIAGLSVGLAACLLIGLFVINELAYDEHWENAERIYRISTVIDRTGDAPETLGRNSSLVLPAMQDFFSREIDSGVQTYTATEQYLVGGERLEERVTWVGPEFTGIFDLEVIGGNLDATLNNPDSLALSVEGSERFFGSADSVGEVVTLIIGDERRDLVVGAVYRQPASGSVLELRALRRLDFDVVSPGWINHFVSQDYVLVSPGIEPEAIAGMMPAFTDQYVDISSLEAGVDVMPSDRVGFQLHRISDLYLQAPFEDGGARGNPVSIMAFTFIAVLVLLAGCVNFALLTNARATQRTREIAVRKIVGAGQIELLAQYLGESLLVVFLAICFSVALAELCLPVFEVLVGKDIYLSYAAPGFYGLLFALWIATALLGGLYPAMALAFFHPAMASRGNTQTEGSGFHLKNALVVFQFAICVSLLVATSVIFLQVNLMLSSDPGFSQDNLLVIDRLRARGDVRVNRSILKQEVARLPGVTSVTLSGHQPMESDLFADNPSIFFRPGDAGGVSLPLLAIDNTFFRTFGIPLVAGRDFDGQRDRPSGFFRPEGNSGEENATGMIINRRAATALGFASPRDALGIQLGTQGALNEADHFFIVIGIAEDSQFYSMHSAARAEAYIWDDAVADALIVRFEGNPETILSGVSDTWRAIMGDAILSAGFVDQIIAREFMQEEREAGMLFSFSVLAMLVACLGLYGSASLTVDRRTKEIGIRKVMGAEVREIVTLLMWQFSKPVLIANIIAWPAAVWAMLTWLQRFPYQIDTLLLIPLCVLAGAIALSIAWLTVAGNTVKVATTNPVYALRYE